MNLSKLRLLLLSLVAVAASGVAQAQGQPVGRVLLAAGDTFAVRNGQPVRLSYNSPIEFKDTLRTGAASSLQVRFNDESLLSLRENTDFTIEDYQFGAGDQDRERAFFRLIKGGFRSVTGLIGRSRNANYRVQTQTATIGIRGTDYAARMCAGDCGANVKDGLYGSVLGMSSGTNQITVQNEGTPQPATFRINQHFYVADARSAPQPLLQPPTFVSIRPQGKAQAAQQGGSGTGGEASSAASGAQAESRPSTVAEPLVTVPLLPFRTVEVLNEQGTVAALPTAVPTGFVVFYPLGSGFQGLWDDDDLNPTFSGSLLTAYSHSTGIPSGSLGGGTISDTGSFTASNGQVLAYGRWTGPTAIRTTSGTSLSNVPLLFGTVSGLLDIDILKTIGGQASYSFVGGPRPIDAGGNAGTVTSSVLNVNFTQLTASYSLGMSFPSIGTFGPATFSVSGSASPASGIHSADFGGSLSGTCTGTGCASASAFGAFDVGLTGPDGFGLGIVGGGLSNATQAGSVVFLNAHTLSSYTPGPAPQFLTGQVGFANTSPFIAGATTSLSTDSTQFNAANQPISFSNPFGTSGSLSSGTIVDTGGTTLIDGSTMNWGRWSGNTVVTQGVTVTNPGTGVPFVIGTSGTTLPTSGTFTYNYAGGPAPVNVNGVSGTFVGGSLNVTFGATSGSWSIASPLTLSLGGQTFSMTSCTSGCTLAGGNVTLGAGSPTFISGTCVGGSCFTATPASGNLSGIFVGPQAAGLATAGNIMASGVPTIVFGAAFKR